MVKHAFGEGEPLLTAEERARQAVESVFAGLTLTEAQERWRDRIQAHLVENLSIEQDHFDLMPIFTHSGGWGRANRDFDGE